MSDRCPLGYCYYMLCANLGLLLYGKVSVMYGGIHDNHFQYIQTTVTSLFVGRFGKNLHQNKWLTKPFTPRHTYIVFPFNFGWCNKDTKKKVVFTVTCLGKKGSVGQDFFVFVFLAHLGRRLTR